MGVLDQVKKMKESGMNEEEIITKLQEQRIAPKQINDALNQDKIKKAVTNGENSEMKPLQEMKKSDQNIYTPQTQEVGDEYYTPSPQQEYYPQPQSYSQNQYATEGYGSEGAYGTQSQTYDSSYYGAQGGYGNYDSSNMIDIAEQVFNEKIHKIQKQVEELNEFKILSQTKLDNVLDRLKKIESIIDKLQIDILKKVGSYGDNLESIKKEMSMMQDSFGKMVPGLAKKKTTRKTSTRKKK